MARVEERWEKAETGRDLFDFRPRVDFKIKHVFDSASGERVTSSSAEDGVRKIE